MRFKPLRWNLPGASRQRIRRPSRPVAATWHLVLWQVHDPDVRVTLHSTAVSIAGQGLYFIDPIPLGAEAMAELLSGGPESRPSGVLVTNGNHARAAADFACRFGISLAATAAAAEEAELEIDETIPPEGGPVFGGAFEAIPLTGAGIGEVAFYRENGGGLAIIGDAVIALTGHEFSLLPDKYCEDPKELRRSLAGLLERRFATLTLAHGNPIMGQADVRLRALLDEGA